MPIELVSLDCAQTLLHVNWDPARLGMDAARELGIELDEPVAHATYHRLLQGRWRAYEQLNIGATDAETRRFWGQLGADWLQALGQDSRRVHELMEVAESRLYTPGVVYTMYPDTIPALDALKANGFKLAVLSNWDTTLFRTLDEFGLTPYFDVIVASLVEGVEKPHPRLFEILTERSAVKAKNILHVGDDPVADVSGARGAGMYALLIDRAPEAVPASGRITALTQILERVPAYV
jgi:putative hydrolase of the HAD superfamily